MYINVLFLYRHGIFACCKTPHKNQENGNRNNTVALDTVDDIQMGYINQAASTEAEFACELNTVHVYDDVHNDVYEEISDYANDNNCDGYMNIMDRSHYENFTATVINNGTEDESSHSRPESQHEGFVGMVEYHDSISNPTKRSTSHPLSESTEYESAYSRPESQHEGFVGMVDYTDSISNPTKRSTSHPLSESTEDESAYSRPESQHEGFVGMVDYTDSVVTPENVTNQVKQMAEDEFGYTIPQNPSNDYEVFSTNIDDKSSCPDSQHEGFVGMVEYTDSVEIHNWDISTEAEHRSGKTSPQGQEDITDDIKQNRSKTNDIEIQYDGFVNIVDYTVSLPTHSEGLEAVTKETEEECVYSRPQSPHEGYVGMVDYSDVLPNHKSCN